MAQDNTDTQDTTTQPDHEDNIRNSAAFKGLAREAAGWKSKFEELEKFKTQVESERASAEQRALAEQGKYEDALRLEQQKQSKLEQDLASSRRQIIEVMAENTLRGMGLSDTLRLRGAVSLLPHDVTVEGLQTWAESLKNDMGESFAPAKTQVVRTAAGHAMSGNVGASSGDPDWTAVKAALFSREATKEAREARVSAQAAYRDYLAHHGGINPPGWEQIKV